MLEVILDALHDGIKTFLVLFIIYILLSFLEKKITKGLNKNNKFSSLYGASIGLIPQCGVSVVASDLYLKRHITIGTLIAVFISCSDEAIPILFSGGNEKALMILPLLIIKFLVGFISGFLIDLFISRKEVEAHLSVCNNEDVCSHVGCCCHSIDDDDEDKFEKHIYHPFIHSLKLFLFIFIINIIFGMIVYFIGRDNIDAFLETNKYFAPLYSVIIGLIPNCASSVILAELFLNGVISFGSILAGLSVNAGLGLVFIFKNKKEIKNNMYILLTLIGISLSVGYLTCLFIGF